MSTAIGDLVANLGMNVQPFQRQLKTATGGLNRFASRTSSTLNRIKGAFSRLKGMGGMGGMLTGVGLLYGAKRAVAAATVQEQAEKKLQAVLAATGGAAGLTAKQLVNYAGELQKVTNFGDETTISAMGILASFRQITGDQFKQATRLAQDMSAMLGTDLKSSVLMLGKALNDPATGMSAMSRAGITFTNQQKEQIRTMQQTGNMLGAQKMILAELERQFGGTAAAMVDPLKQAGNAWGDIMEKIGGYIKPVFVAVAEGFLSAVARVGEYGAALRQWLEPAGGYIMAIVTPLWEMITAFANNPIVQAIAGWVAAVTVFAGALSGLAIVIPAIGGAITAMAGVLGSAITLAMGPIGALLAVIAGVGAALVYAYGTGDTFGEKLSSVFQMLIGYAKSFADGAAFALRNFSAIGQVAFYDLVLRGLELFPMLEGPLQAIGASFVGTWAGIKAFFSTIVGNIIGGLQEIANFAKAVGVGIAAAWEQLLAGNFSGIGKAFGDAFMREFINQADVKAPNALKAFRDAYKDASGEFNERVDKSGGLKGYLGQQRKDLLDGIAKSEAARRLLPERSAATDAAEAAQKASASGKGGIAATAQKKELPKIMERGSQEAWKSIIGAMYKKESPADKAALDNADYNRRSAEGIEKIADREPEEVGI